MKDRVDVEGIQALEIKGHMVYFLSDLKGAKVFMNELGRDQVSSSSGWKATSYHLCLSPG